MRCKRIWFFWMSSAYFFEKDRGILAQISDVARKEGIHAFLVGGYIRDSLLGRYSKDIDISCSGIDSGVALAKAFFHVLGEGASYSVFKRFGTAQVKHKGYVLEFVGMRKESYAEDSRKPRVEAGTLADDLARRDLTINTLALDLSCFPDKVKLIDFHGGLEDIKHKRLRTPLSPSRTFSDDPLRMLRVIRFATDLGFYMHDGLLDAMRAHRDRLDIVSMPRITEELNRMILSRVPSVAFKLMSKGSLLGKFFPEMEALRGVECIDGHTHKDNFYHTLQVLDNVSMAGAGLWLRWAAILHDIAKPLTKAYDSRVGWTFHTHEIRGAQMVIPIFRRFSLPLQSARYVRKLVYLHLRPIALVSKQAGDSAMRRLIYEAGDDLSDLMKLCRADITSKDSRRIKMYCENFTLVEEKMRKVEQKDRLKNFQPPISGNDIIEAFGLAPSPLVGEIKLAIKDAILQGKIANTRTQAWEVMKAVGKEKGLRYRENSMSLLGS